MKWFKILLFLLFGLSAALQFNDPDPINWVLMYGLTAAIALLSFFEKGSRVLELLTMAICLFEMINSFSGLSTWISSGFPDITGHMENAKPYIEETREFIGSSICFITVIFFYIHHSRKGLNALNAEATRSG